MSRPEVTQFPSCLRPQMLGFVREGLPLWMLVVIVHVVLRLRKMLSLVVILTISRVLSAALPQKVCFRKWYLLEGAPHYGHDLGPPTKLGRFAA